jgi:DNA polymerase III epsilon subunit-like protein
MKNNIVIFDFETVGYKPKESTSPYLCDPVQVAAIPITGKTLKVHYDNTFMSYIKPSKGVDAVDKETLAWHCEHKGISEDEMKSIWNKAPVIEAVWPNFVKYLEGYKTEKSEWGNPIKAGHNIIGFDCIVADRMNQKCGISKKIWHPRDFIDTMNILWYWMENDSSINSYSMDNMRKYLGIDGKDAHDALKDCLDCAKIIKRFIRYHRHLAGRVDDEGKKVLDFKNSFKGWQDE